MARILSIDYGSKRVGIAVTDPLQIIATGLTTLHSKDVEQFLKEYFTKEEVERIVVGDPGEGTDAHPLVQAFVNRLRKVFPQVPVELQDETGTSRMAVEAMVKGGMRKMQRRNKAMIDKISATIILQLYLEKQQ